MLKGQWQSNTGSLLLLLLTLTLTPSQLDLPPVPLLISYNIKATEWIKQCSRAEYHLNSLQPVPPVNGGGSFYARCSGNVPLPHHQRLSLCCWGSGLGRELAAATRRRRIKGVSVMRTVSIRRGNMFCYLRKMIPTTCSCGARERAQLERELDWLQHLAKQLKKKIQWQERAMIINVFKSYAHNVQMRL